MVADLGLGPTGDEVNGAHTGKISERTREKPAVLCGDNALKVKVHGSFDPTPPSSAPMPEACVRKAR